MWSNSITTLPCMNMAGHSFSYSGREKTKEEEEEKERESNEIILWKE